MPKQFSRVAQLDNDLIVEKSGGNRFMLVIMAAALARDIRRKNQHSDKFEHLHTPVTALLEFQNGKYDQEYVKRIK